MAGYIGSRIAGIQVDGYTQSEANAEFVNDPNAVITVSGSNVGIGTSSPTGVLDVQDNTGSLGATKDITAEFQRADGTSNPRLQIRHSTSGSDINHTYSTGAGAFTFSNAGTEAMRIDSSGNLHIGKTADSLSTTGITLRPDGRGKFTFDGFEVLELNRLTSDGSIINFFKNTSFVGSISVTGSSTSYNTSSDYRLKENVVPLDGAADRLAQIPVHRFNFIADPSTTVDGFLAHEVQAIVPEAITGEKDGLDADGNPVYQGIDQSKLVPLLTAALQEALQKIDALEARVAALEAV